MHKGDYVVMKGRDLTMKKMDQVDRTVLGTVGSVS